MSPYLYYSLFTICGPELSDEGVEDGRAGEREERKLPGSPSWAIPVAPLSFSWCGFPPGCLRDDWPDHIHILRGAAAEPLTRMLSTWSATKQDLNHYPHQPLAQEVGPPGEEGEPRPSVCVSICTYKIVCERKSVLCVRVFVRNSGNLRWKKLMDHARISFQFWQNTTEDYLLKRKLRIADSFEGVKCTISSKRVYFYAIMVKSIFYHTLWPSFVLAAFDLLPTCF